MRANVYGPKWPHTTGSTTTVYYRYNSPHRYNGNAWQGAKNWRDAANRIKPTSGTSGIKIVVNDIYTTTSYYGQTSIWLNSSKTSFASTEIKLNQRLMDPLNDFDRTFVTTHEFGHAIGLDHTTGTTANSVMKAGGSGFTFPWYNTPMPYDKGEINGLYK